MSAQYTPARCAYPECGGDCLECQPHTQSQPGPWTVGMLEKPQLLPFYVYRNISPRPSFTHSEQLQCTDGGCARFETEDEALAALAKATEGPAP